jgi:hypothetical protein
MRLTFTKYVAITITLLCFSHVSFAGSVKTCAEKTGSTQDFGDATESSKGGTYGQACHETNAWQQLGQATKEISNNITEVELQGDTGGTNDALSTNLGWNSADSQSNDTNNNGEDSGDNGVSWRVADANGDFLGAYGQPELTQGQAVQFQFTVTRSDEGKHQFDELKVWVDWNGQDGFNNDAINSSDSEILYNVRWNKEEDKNDRRKGDAGYSGDAVDFNNDVGAYNNIDTYRSYTLETTIPMDAIVGETWMRARIVCENSLTNYSDNMNLISTGYQDQGEVEDYKLTINQVPEPTTILVFGSALIGLVLSRKKTK